MPEERRGSFFILLLGCLALLLVPPAARTTERPRAASPPAARGKEGTEIVASETEPTPTTPFEHSLEEAVPPPARSTEQPHAPEPSAEPGEEGAKEGAAAKSRPAPTTFCERRFEEAVREYFGGSTPRPFRAQPSILVATVPDPIDSGHDYHFDRVLEAAQAAVGVGANVLRDRSWLPWNDLRAQNDQEARRARACRKTHPGVVLFRPTKNGDPIDGRAVLLVGETPTWGIHRKALLRALQFLEDFGAAPDASGSLDVAIVGPTYSGTAYSLRRTLDEWQRGAHGKKLGDVHIVTGSATNESVREILESKTAPTIRFQTVTIPDSHRARAFYDFLVKDLDVDCRAMKKRTGETVFRLERVALLHEGITQYGQFEPIGRGEFIGRCEAYGADGAAKPEYVPQVAVSFPPNLSALRTARAASIEVETSESLGGLPEPGLHATLRSERFARDIEPNLSFDTTIASDRALANVLGILAREQVRYVGILATNDKDVVFLAHQIRSTYPDVRLFTFSSEISYTHPDYALDLDGMLVASPYPFFGASRYGDGPASMTFSGEMAEGTYNAVLALVKPKARLAGIEPFERNPDHGAPRILPVWVSVVSHGRLWPLAVRGHQLDATPFAVPVDAYRTQARDSDRLMAPTSSPPRSLTLLLLGVATLVAFSVVDFLRFTVIGRTRASSSPLKLLVPPEQPTLELEHSVHVFGLLAPVTALQLLLGMTAYFWARDASSTGLVLGAVALLALGGLAGVASMAAFARASRKLGAALGWFAGGARPAGDRWTAICMSARLATYLVAVIVAAVWASTWLTQGDRTLFLDRSTSITNGVSPFAVLTTAVALLYVWTLGHLARLRTLDGTLPRRCGEWALPISSLLPSPGSGRYGHALARAEMGLSQALRRPSFLFPGRDRRQRPRVARPGIVFFGTTLLLLVPPALLLSLRGIETLEPFGASLLLVGLFIVCFVVICTTLARLLAFVTSFRRVLHQLRRHPILGALGRLPATQCCSVESMTMRLATDPTELSACVDMLATLALRRPSVRLPIDARAPRLEELETWVADARRTLNRHLEQQAAGEILASSDEDRALDRGAVGNEALSRAARGLSKTLVPLWRGDALEPKREREPLVVSRPTPETDAHSERGSPPGADRVDLLGRYEGVVSKDTLDWLRLAEQFVASLVARTVGRTLRYFRHFATSLVASVLLLVLMISLYAFEPRRLLVTIVFVLTLVLAGTAVGTLISFERDPVLSAISNTTPGRVNLSKGLVGRIFTWGVVPLLAVFAAQYPEAARSVLSAFEPLTHAFR